MPDLTPRPAWETRLRDAAAGLEDELRKVVTYINDEVVPDVRRDGSDALRSAAADLHRLAERMDEARRATPPPPPPRPPRS